MTGRLSVVQRIVVLVGLPGSGKSAYCKDLGVPTLSSDAIRLLVADDEDDQTIHRDVFNTLRYLLRQRLRARRPLTYIDATNLTPSERRPYLGIGAKYGCRVEAVFFDVPLEICQRRNRDRRRVVPEQVIKLMFERLAPPNVVEGFSAVHVIRG